MMPTLATARRLSFAALLFVCALAGCSGGCRREVWRGPGKLLDAVSSREGEAAPVPDLGPPPPAATSAHPRLWLRAEDLPRLSAWARAPGGVYARVVQPLLAKTKGMMDKNEELFGKPTCADSSGSDACEAYAMLFGFASLVAPSEADRRDYARRGRVLLMRLVDEAAKGADPKAESWRVLRSAKFSTDDRSRWNGEAFPLAVDWLYPHLTPADKESIRKVFLRWCDENVRATITDKNHPEPIGLVNDPALLKDVEALRFAANNYYTAHMRNLGLMAMALDEGDDPGGKLRAYLRNATGAWLYVVDHLLRHDARGGLGPEGYEYGPQTLSYVMHFLLALHTAGEAVPARWGKQVALGDDRFWDDAITAFLHSQSPQTVPHPWMGQVYQPVWFGDGQTYLTADFVDLFGTLAIHAGLTGKAKRQELARFVQMEMPPGGSREWPARLERINHPRSAILYFLLVEPGAPNPRDPRPTLPLACLAEGLGRAFARTSWGPEASLFHANASWITIDHQLADGGNFGLYRKGEWLTKNRAGYGNVIATSEWQNSLAVENKKPSHSDSDDYRFLIWKRGSQWFNGIADGDPKVEAFSDAPGYTYFHADLTNLYNSTYERSTEVAHTSRAVVWLKPDVVVVYDRAAAKVDGRFKRFWLQLPEPAIVQGSRAVMTTKKGQRLFVTKLLPAAGTMTALAPEPFEQETAELEPMRARLRVEAPASERDTRFLHVLEGSSGEAAPVTLVRGGSSHEGALVGTTVVLFPRVFGPPLAEAVYTVPAQAKAHVLTGLTPGGAYDVAVTPGPDGQAVRVRRGGAKRADAGGVLSF